MASLQTAQLTVPVAHGLRGRASILPTHTIVLHDCRSAAPLNDCRSAAPLDDCRSAVLLTSPIEVTSLGTLRPHPLLRTLPLEDGYRVAFVPSHSQVAVLDSAAQALLRRLPLGEEPCDDATSEQIRELYRLGLLAEGDGRIAPPVAPRVLMAWLHVTNECNLRCSYCYLHKTGETMSDATARAAIDAVIRSARLNGYTEIALKYAGGEAALRMGTIETMHRYAQEQAAAHGLRLQAGLLSNGTTLTERKLATIRRLGLRLMISLDGMAAAHDAQRPTVGGRGSFDATLRGIERAVAAGVTPDIAITVTGSSVDELPSAIGWLLDRDLPFTLSFYRENDCGGTLAELQLDEQRIIRGMRAAYAVIAERPPRWSLLGALLDRADLSAPHARTCAVGENYLVIDHHGRIAKCQMTIEQPLTSVTADDPLALIRADRGGVQNLPADQKEGCRDCAWRYWCAGGCAIATYRATGRYDVQSPNCGIYQSLYPDVLRLEGMRLLHWHRREGSANIRPIS